MGYIPGTNGNDDLYSGRNADSLLGYAGDDTLYGQGGADTLVGGGDDDLLYGGKGGDTFVYTLGDGDDTIADYEEADKIYFQSGTPNFSVKGNDVIVTVGTGSRKGTITIENVLTYGIFNKTITYLDSNGDEHTYPKVIEYNDNLTGATLLSGYNDDVYDATALDSNYSNLATIDASAVTQDLEIIGNKKANKIIGGEGADTIFGGKGADTLTGGAGNDVFAYASGGGKDVITDYESGDVIKITSGTVGSANLVGDDYVFSVGNGQITVKNARNKYIQVEDANGNVSWYPEDPTPYIVYSKGKVTLKEKYSDDSFDVTAFESGFAGKVYTIDASAVTHSLNITANKESNDIIGTAQKDTISGGDGADTITGGKGNDVLIGGDGADVFSYTKGDGKDTILDYEEEDSIFLNGVTLKNTVASGDNVVLQLVGSSKITLVGAAGKEITFVDADNPDPDEDHIEFSNKGKMVTLLEKYSENSFDVNQLSAYASKVVTIDASEVENDLYIVGNKKKNVIIGTDQKDTIDGGAGADTITGGEGNDILTGGNGADVFLYEKGDGKDRITDYEEEDKIILDDVKVKSTVTANSGNDVVLNLTGGGKITVTGGAGKTISGEVDGVETVFYGGKSDTMSGPTIEGALFNDDYTAVTLTADFMNESFTTDDYSSVQSRLKTIDASKVEHELTIGGSALANNIIGTDDDDYIYGGAGKDTLNGGKGNDLIEGGNGNDKLFGGTGKDTLWGGKGDDQLTGGGANDTFIYNGDGNDRITDYVWGYDKIVCLDSSVGVSNVAAEGSDVVFTMSNGNELTLANAAGKAAQIVDGSGNILKQYTARA